MPGNRQEEIRHYTLAAMLTLLLRPILALFALLTALTAPVAQAATQRLPTPQPKRQVAVPAAVRPALWKVQRGKSVIYLFGTVHALPKNVPWMDGKVADATEQADTLITEILDKDPSAMRSVVMQTAMLPQGQTLRAKLTPASKASLEKVLAADGLPAAAFDAFRPWYAAVALSTLPLMKSGYDPTNGVDVVLSGRFKDAKKAHEALETPEYQLGLFNQLPESAQIRYLDEVLKDADKIPDDLAKMIKEWKAGHADELARLMNEDESDPVLLKLLLIDRNKAWARWIKARLTKPGTVLLAVGAGHLAGKGSVQDQLATMGIKVARVQ